MDISEWDFDAVADRNRQNLKDLGDGQTTSVKMAQNYILIGDNHPQEYLELFNDERASFYDGKVTIEKGGMTDPGSLTFEGIRSDRSTLDEHIAQFSKKKVLYSD